MPGLLPKNANDSVELHLDAQARRLERALTSHVLAFNGPIFDGADDAIRDAIEGRRKSNLAQKKLSVILTSPGGSIEVTQRIAETLRHHYDMIDFIVPNAAYSAGTVLVMSGDAIWMDYYSRLGPIDPQMPSGTDKLVPGLGYLIQYERLLKKANEGHASIVEIQLLLDGFDQAELYKIEQAAQLSKTLLQEWLVRYKFKNWVETETSKTPVTDQMRAKRAEEIASQLSDPQKWHSHGRGIPMKVLQEELKLLIDDFGVKPGLRDMIRNYEGLINDYMSRVGHVGAVHTVSNYLKFM